MTLNTACRIAVALTCTLMPAVAPRQASADVSAAAPSTQAAIAAAVEKERKTYGPKTPVPGGTDRSLGWRRRKLRAWFR